MKTSLDRRRFLQASAAASAGLALGLGTNRPANAATRQPVAVLPMGRIGNLNVSRLISGGNLISGWAHSRDLKYVPELMRHYNTDEKVMDTLELLEENGVNTIISDPAERPLRIFPKYWKERGGKIQWIAEGHPNVYDQKTNILHSIDHGASAIYIQGVIGDQWLRSGHIDLLGECMEIIKGQGVPAGIGAHLLPVIKTAEERGYGAEFYVKTFHHSDYWSARRPDQNEDVVYNEADNYWEMTPVETAAYMKTVTKPWIAFKVLAAGAILPDSGFRFAFEGGADFICVGMFDFQVKEDADITRSILSDCGKRERAWVA